jgi:hypothetical protein
MGGRRATRFEKIPSGKNLGSGVGELGQLRWRYQMYSCRSQLHSIMLDARYAQSSEAMLLD